jgi:isoquinoline 1-oxidoreductase subunit beta
MSPTLDRRDFVKVTVAAGAGLALAFSLPGCAPEAEDGPGADLNAFLHVRPDGSVVVTSKHMEMGQGSYTGLATILAEEMDADWAKVSVVGAPGDASKYGNNAIGGMQLTGGSNAMANSWEQMRKAGATARAMLIAAAAAEWQVEAAGITVVKGIVSHPATGKSGHIGKFAVAAATQVPPADVPLKARKDWGLIGQDSLRRVDAVEKSTGKAQFTQDVKLPGMLTAIVAHPPRWGATVKSFAAAATKAVPGVVDVVQVPTGVAVLANTFWAAKKGRDALTIQWDETNAEKRGSDQLMTEYRALARRPGKPAGKRGNADRALAGAGRVVQGTYTVPYLAHAAMEPMNCVAQVSPGRCELWYGAQGHTFDQMAVGRALGLKPEQVTINSLYAGGGFGRRANPISDYVVEAALVAKGANGRPVKLVWTREDDTNAGWYRPMFLHAVRAGIDGGGKIAGWHHKVVGQSVLAAAGFVPPGANDPSSTEGVHDLHYEVPDLAVELYTTTNGVPVQWWRSVGHTHTAFAVESFIDELAAAARRDPVAFRLDHLKPDSRYAAVLRLAAEKAGWDTIPPVGHARGVAVHESFDTVVAEVAEVSIRPDKTVQVHKVVCAVDCGTVINPDIVRAQIEGGVMFGLSAALHGQITLTEGRPDQHSYDTYKVLRMEEAPVVEVYVLPSENPPTGVGEPGVPPIAPAVANAVFKLTGVRVRDLPFGEV